MEVELEVVGRHAMLFDDDATAAFVNSKDALIDWNSLSIDRFDVRNLLTNPPSSFRKLSVHGGGGGVSPDFHLEAELDLERYADLPSSSDELGLFFFSFALISAEIFDFEFILYLWFINKLAMYWTDLCFELIKNWIILCYFVDIIVYSSEFSFVGWKMMQLYGIRTLNC